MNIGQISTPQKKDDHAFIYVVLSAIIILLTQISHPFQTIPAYWKFFETVWERNNDLMIVLLAGLGISVLFFASAVGRILGSRQSGQKLQSISGTKTGNKTFSISEALFFVAGFAIAYGSLLAVWLPNQIQVLHLKHNEFNEWLVFGFRMNLAFAIAACSSSLARTNIFGLLKKWNRRRLPKFPELKNTLVLGAVNEEEPDEKPSWAISDLKALVGNIIITGSIGSGKTAGTILTYIAQILSNFDPRPALLAIDPKGKITQEIKKIAIRLGLGEHVLHMKLAGRVTFNPIYLPRALKGAGFSDIAKMIRAAAVNYMGKSFDSPFWEQSAGTLVKNCLIHCAATKSYYTLNDLYTTMVKAVSDDEAFIKDLEACLKNDRFDAEEKANISFALQYFHSEYRQLDEKVRTGILATSTTFLNQFQEYQASEIFCPPEESLTIRSMDEILVEGKILLFDITNDGLARSMGTFVKLHYEKAILKRLKLGQSTERPGVLLIDEYQDVVTTGYGTDFGDEMFLAEGREANAISIVATQSLSSLENSIGRDKPTHVLWNGFRTKILGHSSDLATIKSYQELAGKEEKKRVSHSYSEHSQDASPNLFMGGFDARKSNISESVNTSEQKEYVVTAQEFSRLNTFEAFMMMYDGVGTVFRKLYLKPYYLEKKNTPHSKVLASLRPAFAVLVLALAGIPMLSASPTAYAFPNVCTVMKSKDARSCMDFTVGSCMCGWPIPRPCANFSYYVPQTFIEVMPEPKSSFFGDMPGAASQLAALGPRPIPYGVEGDDDTQTFQSHVTSVPFTEIPFQALPCGGGAVDRLCFEGMSEHLGSNWTTGSADLLQPNFLAWGISPKACLLKGAATSLSGEPGGGYSSSSSCSFPLQAVPKYPPSSHSACTGWGVFYPRIGVYNGPAQTTGALMVAARMKSLSTEIFHATPASFDEIWQMIYPQSSSCFREGQNVGILDTIKNVREIGRLTSGKLTGYLFTVWSKVSCCRDLAEVPAAYAAIEAMNLACQGLGG